MKISYDVSHAQGRVQSQAYEVRHLTIRSVVTRSDGYVFLLCENSSGKLLVYAGCHQGWTIGEYRRHVKRSYRWLGKRACAGKTKETLAILDLFAFQIKARWHY